MRRGRREWRDQLCSSLKRIHWYADARAYGAVRASSARNWRRRMVGHSSDVVLAFVLETASRTPVRRHAAATA